MMSCTTWCKILIYFCALMTALTGALVMLYEPQRINHGHLPSKLRPFRPIPIRIGNALHYFLKTTFDYEILPLDVDVMLAASCAKHQKTANTTTCDWGEKQYGDFRPSFRSFFQSLVDEGKLTLIGRVFASHRAQMLLDQRLQMIHYWKHDGVEVHSQTIKRPLFVAGLPRTGTTFLHTLLAQDTDTFIAPLNWMVVNPMPPNFGYIDEDQSNAVGDRKALIDDANYNLDQFKSIAKDVDAQHVMSAFTPEECIVFQAHTFVAFEFLTYFTLPSYSNWLRDIAYPGKEYNDAFRWHKQVLKHLTSVAPESVKKKSWVLKTPFHMGMLDDMIDVYPDARVVMTHRRPVRALTSLSSLQVKLRTVSTDVIQPKEFAQEFLSLHSTFAGRAVESRERWKKEGTDQKRTVDVGLSELHSNPMKVVERIYNHFDMDLSDDSRDKMEYWLAHDGARGKHGSNVYKAEWFGLENQQQILSENSGLKKYDDFYCGMFECVD